MPEITNGIGTKHYGKENYVEFSDADDEEFDTTLWFVLFWIPIFPIKSYRIRQKSASYRYKLFPERDELGQSVLTTHFYIISEYKRNWKQIFKTYVSAFLILVLSLFGIVLFFYIYSLI